MSGVIGVRDEQISGRVRNSTERLVASANWSREDAPFSGHRLPILLHLLQCVKCL